MPCRMTPSWKVCVRSLRREHDDRTPTPLRLFCRPFQDLLTCEPRKAKQKAAIARGSLVPVWTG